MSEITKEFLDDLDKKFKEKYESDRKIENLLNKIKNEKATSQDAFDYSKEVGLIRKDILHEGITDNVLNNGYLGYYNSKDLFNDVLYKDYELINQYCKDAFTIINKKAGLNLNGLGSDYDQSKTDGIIECAVKDLYENVRNETEEAIVTNAKSYYDSAVKNNADFQYKSGMDPKIIRTAVGKTCKWCNSLAGVYDYGNMSDYISDNVFRRHANCDCLVVYQPSKGKYQDVWSKQWMDDTSYRQERAKRIVYNQKYSDNSLLNSKKIPVEIKHEDDLVVKEFKKEFKGYIPAQLSNGEESGCNMDFISNGNKTYRIKRTIINTALEAKDINVDLNNPALANSYHERGHDILNCLSIKRAGIVYEGMISYDQIVSIDIEYHKLLEELYIAAFPNDIYGDISNEDIVELISKEISTRAIVPDELFSEVAVKVHDINKSDIAERIYNYIKKEWNK